MSASSGRPGCRRPRVVPGRAACSSSPGAWRSPGPAAASAARRASCVCWSPVDLARCVPCGFFLVASQVTCTAGCPLPVRRRRSPGRTSCTPLRRCSRSRRRVGRSCSAPSRSVIRALRSLLAGRRRSPSRSIAGAGGLMSLLRLERELGSRLEFVATTIGLAWIVVFGASLLAGSRAQRRMRHPAAGRRARRAGGSRSRPGRPTGTRGRRAPGRSRRAAPRRRACARRLARTAATRPGADNGAGCSRHAAHRRLDLAQLEAAVRARAGRRASRGARGRRRRGRARRCAACRRPSSPSAPISRLAQQPVLGVRRCRGNRCRAASRARRSARPSGSDSRATSVAVTPRARARSQATRRSPSTTMRSACTAPAARRRARASAAATVTGPSCGQPGSCSTCATASTQRKLLGRR